MKLLHNLKLFLINFLVLLVSATSIFPIIWMIYSSLKTPAEFAQNTLSLPSVPTFENYISAINEAKLLPALFNSLFNGIVSVIFIILFSFNLGYYISRYTFRGRKLLYVLLTAGMLIPVHCLMIPVFVEFKTLNLLDQRFTLILPYIALGLPMAFLLIESFIGSVPKDIEEAAYIDGSSVLNTVVKIIFPLCKPIISTVFILSFLSSWNEFPFALVLISKTELATLPLALKSFSGQYTIDYTKLFAALVIVTLPVLIAYLLSYKKVIAGMTAGSVKG